MDTKPEVVHTSVHTIAVDIQDLLRERTALKARRSFVFPAYDDEAGLIVTAPDGTQYEVTVAERSK